MKIYTHPPLSHTSIRYKDGSSYSKFWRYLRSTLILEGDQKEWESGISSSSGVNTAKVHKSISYFSSFAAIPAFSSLHEAPVRPFTQQGVFFWSKN